MYQVRFYKDKNGKSSVEDYILELASKKDKDSRIKLNKIRDYIKVLSEYGTRSGEPYVKHLCDDIWELRPLRDRLLFAAWDGEKFILLHHFMKQTQKTPQREIEKALKNWNDLLERSKLYERK